MSARSYVWSRGSSISIVSGYGLDDQAIEVRSPLEARDFFSNHRPDDGGSTYLWNVGRQLFYTAVNPRRQIWTSYSPPWELEISNRRTISLSFTELFSLDRSVLLASCGPAILNSVYMKLHLRNPKIGCAAYIGKHTPGMSGLYYSETLP
jgi:hypothetical protein